jgi:hypothetical protein
MLSSCDNMTHSLIVKKKNVYVVLNCYIICKTDLGDSPGGIHWGQIMGGGHWEKTTHSDQLCNNNESGVILLAFLNVLISICVCMF